MATENSASEILDQWRRSQPEEYSTLEMRYDKIEGALRIALRYIVSVRQSVMKSTPTIPLQIERDIAKQLSD